MKKNFDNVFIVVMLIILCVLTILLFIESMFATAVTVVDNTDIPKSVLDTSDIHLTSGVSDVIYDMDVDIEEVDDIQVKQGNQIDGAPIEVPCDNERGYDILYTSARVNVRREPDDGSDNIIKTLDIGEEVKIYGSIANDVWSWTINEDTNEKMYIYNAYLCWEKPKGNSYTDEELELLAHLIFSENGTLGEKGMLYTGSVVLNRVNSQYFPDTLYDVIYQHGQYQVTWNGGINKKPSELAYNIAERLLKYGSVLPENVIWQAEFEQGDGLYTQVGNTKFCYSNNY